MVSIFGISIPVETRSEEGATNAYLIGKQDGILVDPAARTEALDEAVAERTIQHIGVTHTHPDHVGAVEHYATRTGATVWCRTGYESRFREATNVSPDKTFREGAKLPGAMPVTVMDTPGHAPDHVAYVVRAGEAGSIDVVVGDLITATGSIFVGPPDGDMHSYMVSLRRLLQKDPRCLYPGHGNAIAGPSRRIKDLLEHRRQRERRVQRAVDDGASSVDEVVDMAYDKDLSGVRDLAAATVQAHLSKLRTEGRIRWEQ